MVQQSEIEHTFIDIMVDIETTGLDHKDHGILQVAMATYSMSSGLCHLAGVGTLRRFNGMRKCQRPAR